MSEFIFPFMYFLKIRTHLTWSKCTDLKCTYNTVSRGKGRHPCKPHLFQGIDYFFHTNYLFIFYFKNYFIVVQLQLSAFSPHPSIPPQPNPPLSSASTLPLGFVHVSFIVVPENPSPILPSPLPSGYCQIVLNFNVSGYILFAFFCWLCSI